MILESILCAAIAAAIAWLPSGDIKDGDRLICLVLIIGFYMVARQIHEHGNRNK